MNDQQEKREVPQVAHVLAQINRGALADEAAILLADLVQQVTAVGKPGTLTITVQVKPFTGGGDTVQVNGKVTVTPPARDPHGGIFYFTDQGGLTRNDPHQQKNTLFDVKEVPAP